MSDKATPHSHSDTRLLGGRIRPARDGKAQVETRRAVLLERVTVAEADAPGASQSPVVALELEGRVNRSPDRARVLYLASPEGAAMLVEQLADLARRSENTELRAAIKARLAAGTASG